MTRREKLSAALYVVTLVAAFVFIIFALCRCVGSSIQAVAVDASECEKEMSHAVLVSSSCNEAQFKVDAVIATNPACKNFPHFAVCALVDGGSHGDH